MKQIFMSLILLVFLTLSCSAQAQRPIIFTWDKNSESDMSHYVLLYTDTQQDSLPVPTDTVFYGGDKLSNYTNFDVAHIDQPPDTGTVSYTFGDSTWTFSNATTGTYLYYTPNAVNKYGRASIAAVDLSGNASRIADEILFYLKNLPPGTPTSLAPIVVPVGNP